MRIIGHLDMDAFFAAVEERDNDRFRGKPIVVGADPAGGRGRGVVSTANYKAREYGIHSAMAISEAWRRAEEGKRKGGPAVIFLGGNFKKYGAVSAEIMVIIRGYALLVEEASIDEAYFDLSSCGSYEKARELALKIKAEVKEKERLTATIGIGPNKLIAKIASDMQKPDGLTVVKDDEAEKFLEPLAIRKIPGIGPKTQEFFRAKGVKIVRDLKKFSKADLEKFMGKWGLELYEKIRGKDDSPIVEDYEVKSIGEQETFMADTRDLNFISERLSGLCESVIARFKASGFKTYKTIILSVRFADFETKSRAHTLEKPACDLATLRFEAMRLLVPFLDKRENPRGKLIRLIGVRVEKLV